MYYQGFYRRVGMVKMLIAASSLFFSTLFAPTPSFAAEKSEPTVDRLPTGSDVFRPKEQKKTQSWIPESARNPATDSEKKSGQNLDTTGADLHPDTDDDLVFRR